MFVLLWPLSTMLNIGRLGRVEIACGEVKERDGAGSFLVPFLLASPPSPPPPLPPYDSRGVSTFFFIKAVTRAEKVWRSKKTRHDLVNFDLFLYSVQSQLSSTPPAGESSYKTNVSGGHASIGDHSVTIVETTTPR